MGVGCERIRCCVVFCGVGMVVAVFFNPFSVLCSSRRVMPVWRVPPALKPHITHGPDHNAYAVAIHTAQRSHPWA